MSAEAITPAAVVESERVPLVSAPSSSSSSALSSSSSSDGVVDVERAETDSAFARRLAQEELDGFQTERRQREEQDLAYATAVRSQEYRRAPPPPYYFGAYNNAPRRPVVVYRDSYDDWCCFCWLFWYVGV